MSKGKSIVVISSVPKGIKRKYIYTITCLGDIPSYCIDDPVKRKEQKKKNLDNRRCFGWFSSFSRAKKAVDSNEFDLHEYYYRYAIIEKTSDGIHNNCRVPTEWWFEWKGSSEDGKFVPIEKPSVLKSVIGWGIG